MKRLQVSDPNRHKEEEINTGSSESQRTAGRCGEKLILWCFKSRSISLILVDRWNVNIQIVSWRLLYHHHNHVTKVWFTASTAGLQAALLFPQSSLSVCDVTTNSFGLPPSAEPSGWSVHLQVSRWGLNLEMFGWPAVKQQVCTDLGTATRENLINSSSSCRSDVVQKELPAQEKLQLIIWTWKCSSRCLLFLLTDEGAKSLGGFEKEFL